MPVTRVGQICQNHVCSYSELIDTCRHAILLLLSHHLLRSRQWHFQCQSVSLLRFHLQLHLSLLSDSSDLHRLFLPAQVVHGLFGRGRFWYCCTALHCPERFLPLSNRFCSRSRPCTILSPWRSIRRHVCVRMSLVQDFRIRWPVPFSLIQHRSAVV